jgi:hypothetical protein
MANFNLQGTKRASPQRDVLFRLLRIIGLRKQVFGGKQQEAFGR